MRLTRSGALDSFNRTSSAGTVSKLPSERPSPRIGSRLSWTFRLILIPALLLAVAPVARAHFPHDVIYDAAVSPDFANDATLFAVTRGNLVRSNDGAKSWQRITQGLGDLTPYRIALSPAFAKDRNVFLASKRGVFRSTDAGLQWHRCDPTQADVDVVDLAVSPGYAAKPTVVRVDAEGVLSLSDDGCETWRVATGLPSDIAAVRWTPAGLFVGSENGRVNRSSDGGNSWHDAITLPGDLRVTAIETVAVKGSEQIALLVGTAKGLYRVAPSAATAQIVAGVPDTAIASLATIHTSKGETLLAATHGQAAFRSDDGGATWTRHSEGLVTDDQADWAKLPHWSHLSVADDGTILLAGFTGLFRSQDLGSTWTELETLGVTVIVGLAVSPETDTGHRVSVSTYGGGVFSWAAGDSNWRVDNEGLPYPRMGTIAYSPDYANDRSVFTGTYHWILRSQDSGAGWERASVEYRDEPGARAQCGLPTFMKPVPHHYKFEMALWFAFSPAFASDGIMFAGYRPEGLVRSTDGGRTFEKIWHGCGNQVSAVVVSPAFANDRTLFAAINRYLYRSRDAGESWQQVRNFAGFDRPNLVISPFFETDQSLYAASTRGLWRSRDGGDSWQQVPLGGGNPAIARGGLAIAPSRSGPVELLVQTAGGPLYFVRDDGDRVTATATLPPAEFSQMREFERDRTPLIAFSPDYTNDDTVYAASMDQVFRSTNRGVDWKRLGGALPVPDTVWPVKPPGFEAAKKRMPLLADPKP